jgi:hypothetical protein
MRAMVTAAKQQSAEPERVYSVYFYGRGRVVPEMQFLEAASDDEAYVRAGSMKPWMTREIWDRHRQVRVLPPSIRAADRR